MINMNNQAMASKASASANVETNICSITNKPYTGYGNNAYPFDGRCCDEANKMYVIPARILGITPEDIKAKGKDNIKRIIMKETLKMLYNN